MFDDRRASPQEASLSLAQLWSHWADSDPPGPPYIRHFVSLLPDGRQRLHEYFSGLSIDFASFNAIKFEVEAVYRSPDTLLPPVPVFSFRDYVLADLATRRSERGAASMAWWRQRIPHYPESLTMPMMPSFKADRARMRGVGCTISPEQCYAIETRCETLGASASVCWFAVLGTVWAAYHTSRRFTVAMMYSRRLPLHPTVATLRGSFTTVVPLEIDLTEGRSFNDLLRSLQDQVQDINKHRWCAGLDVMTELSSALGRTGISPLPYVISSSLTAGNTFIPSAAFSAGVRGMKPLLNAPLSPKHVRSSTFSTL